MEDLRNTFQMSLRGGSLTGAEDSRHPHDHVASMRYRWIPLSVHLTLLPSCTMVYTAMEELLGVTPEPLLVAFEGEWRMGRRQMAP